MMKRALAYARASDTHSKLEIQPHANPNLSGPHGARGHEE